jgi:hypothetical protein
MKTNVKIKTLHKLDEAYKTSRLINLAVIICFFLSIVVVVVVYKSALIRGVDRVYVVKDNSMFRINDERSMVKGHVTDFFKLFFEIDQFNYKSNVNKALYLIGEDGQTLNKSLTSSNFYSQLVATNMICSIQLDSIVFRTNQAPYELFVYGKWMKRNEYAKKINNLHCAMEVVKTSNSDKNPYGFVIEKFRIFNQEELKVKE